MASDYSGHKERQRVDHDSVDEYRDWGTTLPTFTCSTQYTAEDCRGQLVRWHVLQYAYQAGAGGRFHVGWYDWESHQPLAAMTPITTP